MNPAVRQLLMSGPRVPVTTLLTVSCGNSISVAGQYLNGGGPGWNFRSEVQLANMLAGGCLRFPKITASISTDAYGCHGLSGNRLDQINADIPANWIATVNAGGAPPELVIGNALIENDLAQDSTLPEMMARVDQWIAIVRAAWPKAIIQINTPHPSFSYTGGIVAKYQAMRDFILAKDNGRSIIAARADGYEDPANPGWPLSGYTDATVHPNAKGALVIARSMATALGRLGAKSTVYGVNSVNQFLTGSVAATGTNVSGTRPSSCAITGTVDGTYVSTANNPGWSVECSTPVAGTHLDIGTFDTGPTAAAPAMVSAYARLQVVSGGANLRAVELAPRLQDSGGNTFRYHLVLQSADPDLDFVDGDVLTFVSPPMLPNSGAFSSLRNYIRPRMKNTTSSTTIKVLESGFYTVQ